MASSDDVFGFEHIELQDIKSFQTTIGDLMNTANRDYQEKRNFIRMKIETPAQIELHEGDQVFQGICRDLSGGGMLVELATALPVGSEVKVQIASAHGHAPMLEAITEVARVVAQPGTEEAPCLLGLEIKSVIS